MIDWLALVRFIHIAASILLAAVFVFRLIVLVPTMFSERGQTDESRLSVVYRRLVLAAWLLVVGSGLAWLGLVIVSIGGGASWFETKAETVEIILFRTQFGRLWLFRAACCLVMALFLLKGCRLWVRVFFSMVILTTLAGAGHAGANPSTTGLFVLAVDVGHLVAAAFWPGGLVPLLCFLCAQTRAAEKGNWSVVARVTRKFSVLSLAAVTFLAATGILNACFMVGSFRSLLLTFYGQLLLFKIGLFLLMIGFGAANLLVLKPGVIRLAAVDKQEKPPEPVLLLIRSVICETALAAALLLVVGFLGVTPPPIR